MIDIAQMVEALEKRAMEDAPDIPREQIWDDVVSSMLRSHKMEVGKACAVLTALFDQIDGGAQLLALHICLARIERNSRRNYTGDRAELLHGALRRMGKRVVAEVPG